MINRIKNALERETWLLRSKGEDTLKKELTHKLESLCRVFHVSESNRRELEKHLEGLLAERVKAEGTEEKVPVWRGVS